MKNLLQPNKLLILVLLLIPLKLFSQTHIFVPVYQPEKLTANAGMDTTVQEGLSIQIGGSPSALGGTGVYTYFWSPPNGIDDVHAANPITTPSADITYSLLVTDQNECTSSDEINITFVPSTNVDLSEEYSAEVLVYPNPAISRVTIRFEKPITKDFTLTLFNSSGKSIYSNTYNNSIEIVLPFDRSLLSQGMYFILLRNSEFTISKKLIIN